MTTTHTRNEALDRLALGVNCPRCQSSTDEPCRSLGGRPTLPHSRRIDRAVAKWPSVKGLFA